jgi:rare lipoprotein A
MRVKYLLTGLVFIVLFTLPCAAQTWVGNAVISPNQRGGIYAAHAYLPFGSIIKVTNLSNQKTIMLIIGDRLPKHDPNLIELSVAAADAIGLSKPTRVQVELLKHARIVNGKIIASLPPGAHTVWELSGKVDSNSELELRNSHAGTRSYDGNYGFFSDIPCLYAKNRM